MYQQAASSTLLAFQWAFANAFAFGFGWHTARPLAIEVADQAGPTVAITVFLLVFAGIPISVQGLLVVYVRRRSPERLASPRTGTGGLLRLIAMVAVTATLASVGLALWLQFSWFYAGMVTWVLMLGLIRESLRIFAPPVAGSTRGKRYGWRTLWIPGATLALAGLAVVGAQPWVLGDKCPTCGHVPATVLGGLFGAVAGLALMAVDLRQDHGESAV